jgi:DNA polymerase III subunit delta'
MSHSPTRSQTAAELLRRSLERGRLGHAYLFVGESMSRLEDAARQLAATVNCLQPPVQGLEGLPVEPCLQCRSCVQILQGRHPDLVWLRPENKLRIINIEQVRELGRVLSLRAGEARRKVAIIAGADRLNIQAANAFLKTLEEPPSGSILILLSTDPERMLETIHSRCLRLSFASGQILIETQVAEWVGQFAELARGKSPDLFDRYRLLTGLLQTLTRSRETIENRLTEASPLSRHTDVEPALKERWEDELTASVEAEYRRHRGDYLAGLHAWLRDIWVMTQGADTELAFLPRLAPATRAVAARLTRNEAGQNLSVIERTLRRLHTNAQEALVLEVGLLQLKL